MISKLDELFKSYVDWQWTSRSDDQSTAEFEINGKQFSFSAANTGQYGHWDMEFENLSVDPDDRFSITGQGNAATILATVVDIMRKFLKNNEVYTITFVAIEPNRKKLYQRMLKTLLSDWPVKENGSTLRAYNPRFMQGDEELTESRINPADAKAVFKTASDMRTGKPKGFGRIFKSLRKDKIELSDLQQAWQSEGYPDDTRDIGAILTDHGFDKKEINKVFSEVFGKQDGNDQYDEPVASETIQKIANYAKENDFAEELKSFLSKEFGFKESTDYGKAMVEDVRAIFTSIVNEERRNREYLIKKHEQAHLGRKKK